MIQRVLSHYHLSSLTCVALVLFMLVFFGAIMWVFRQESKTAYSHLKNMPFEDQNHV